MFKHTCHFCEISVTVNVTLQCNDGAADKTAPGLGPKPIRRVLSVTAKLRLSQVSSCLCEENYRSEEGRGLLFSGIFILVYPPGVSCE